jgi:hypothetical protein
MYRPEAGDRLAMVSACDSVLTTSLRRDEICRSRSETRLERSWRASRWLLVTRSESDRPVPALTPAERARLRPSVDVNALERFLAEIPEDVRPGVKTAVVLHFSQSVTMADIRDFLRAVGNDHTAAAVDRAIATQPAKEPGAIPDEPKPAKSDVFTMEPPESPQLRALWEAIEPRRPSSG